MAAEGHERPTPAGIDLHYGHPRMPLSERAKIFMPFDPLKGFRKALEEQERRSRASLEDGRPAEEDA